MFLKYRIVEKSGCFYPEVGLKLTPLWFSFKQSPYGDRDRCFPSLEGAAEFIESWRKPVEKKIHKLD